MKNPGTAIGGALGTAAFVTLLVSAYPIFKKIMKPRNKKNKGERATGRDAKRSLEEDVLDEWREDPELGELFEL